MLVITVGHTNRARDFVSSFFKICLLSYSLLRLDVLIMRVFLIFPTDTFIVFILLCVPIYGIIMAVNTTNSK
jgi:hypothetical protein